MKQHILINIHGEKKKLSKHDAERRRRECESTAAAAAAAVVVTLTAAVDGAHPAAVTPLSSLNYYLSALPRALLAAFIAFLNNFYK